MSLDDAREVEQFGRKIDSLSRQFQEVLRSRSPQKMDLHSPQAKSSGSSSAMLRELDKRMEKHETRVVLGKIVIHSTVWMHANTHPESSSAEKADIQSDRQTGRQIDRPTDTQTQRETDRQTE
jgi:hypothetical protein